MLHPPHNCGSADLQQLLLLICGQIRREILLCLARRPRCVLEVAESLHIGRSLVSKHLGPLWLAQIVQFERRGHKKIFSLSPSAGVTMVKGGMQVALRDNRGNVLALLLTPESTQELDWEVQVKPPPTPGGVTNLGAAKRVPRGDTPPGPRPPKAP